MKDFIVVGTGEFADLIVDTIENDMHRKVAAYTVDQKYLKEKEYNGKPVVAIEEVAAIYPPEQYAAVICFIGSRMYEQRYEKYQCMKSLGYEMENVIHSTASISQNATMGDGNIFLQYTIVAHGAQIGCCNVFTPKAYVCHHVTVGNACYFAPGVSTTGYVEIGNNCFLGVNSAVNNKVKIADYTFIGGGIFVTQNTEKYDLYLPEKTEPKKRLRSIDFLMFTSRRRN